MELIKHSDVGILDYRETMYPSYLEVATVETVTVPGYSTAYGVVVGGHAIIRGRKVLHSEYFCVANPTAQEEKIIVEGRVAVFVRLGYLGQTVLCGQVESVGRVEYIDTCTDSLLVYPPRKGDPCLNSLHFPMGVNQTFHTHPTIRLGCVLSGEGIANVKVKGAVEARRLQAGDVFCIEPHEVHRFSTVDSKGMTIIAYHPDSDFGPTDENHPMKNRTYI